MTYPNLRILLFFGPLQQPTIAEISRLKVVIESAASAADLLADSHTPNDMVEQTFLLQGKKLMLLREDLVPKSVLCFQ